MGTKCCVLNSFEPSTRRAACHPTLKRFTSPFLPNGNLASGPGRVFPPFVALVEIIRGLTSVFNDGGLDHKFRNFSINVIDPGVIQLIRAGKLNLQELLLVGLFRIGVEIWRSEDEVLRFSELVSENTEISEIRARYYIPENG